MYLVGLPRIAVDLNASESQLHIAFSVTRPEWRRPCCFAGKIIRQWAANRSRSSAQSSYDGLLLCSRASEGSLFLVGVFFRGDRCRRLLCGGVRHLSARHARRAYRRAKCCVIEWDYLYYTRPGGGAFDYASFPWQSLFCHDVRDGHYCGPVITVYHRETRGKITRFITIVARRRVVVNRFSLVDWRCHPWRVGDPDASSMPLQCC